MPSRSIPLLAALLALVVTACASQLVSQRPALRNDEAEVYLYLQPFPQELQKIDFTLETLSLVRDDGSLVQLLDSPLDLKGRERLDAQRRLASVRVAPGSYRGIAVGIAAASAAGAEEGYALLVPDESIFVEHEFTAVGKRATTLFLSLHADELGRSSVSFTPTFSLARPRRNLPNLLGFVTNSARNTVSVFDKNSMQVVNTIATRTGPKGVAIDQDKGWVYVALAGDDAIEAIEVTTSEVLASTRLNLGDEPTEISLSPDGTTLVTANLGSNSVSIVDASSLREVGRVGLPSDATSVVVDASGSRAFVLHSRSNALSIVDLSRQALLATRPVAEAPTRAAISKDGRQLYVITGNSPNLLVMDPVALTVLARIFVGFGAVSLRVDAKTDQIYVGKRTGEIVVIGPSSLMFVDTLRARGDAAFLAIDNDEGSLFVVSPTSRTLQKLDLISKKFLGAIDVEAGSYAVAVMGER